MTNINIQHGSALRQLRSLMPARTLSYLDALQRAELQASRLLSLHAITSGPVPSELVAGLPRVRVEYDCDIPASGSAVWDGCCWVITLNATEHPLRQRFSLFHELKHIIDHPTRHLIEGDRHYRLSGDEMAERVADYFAACVLMPKAWVKAAYCAGVQSVQELAARFDVSPRAMAYRLTQLGLTMPSERCLPRTSFRRKPTVKYFRQRALVGAQL